MSAVMAPLEAFGRVSRQNGTSSTIEATVGLLRPMTLKWLFDSSCAAAPNASDTPSAIPASERCDMVPSSLDARSDCCRGRAPSGLRPPRRWSHRSRGGCKGYASFGQSSPAMLQNGAVGNATANNKERKEHVDHHHGSVEHRGE